MTERVKKIYDRLLSREYRKLRDTQQYDFAEKFSADNLDLYSRSAKRFELLCQKSRPLLFEGDEIGFMRSVTAVMPIITDAEMDNIKKTNFVFDGAQVGNISSDYASIISRGFEAVRADIESRQKTAEGESKLMYRAMLDCIKALYGLCDKYRAEAKAKGLVSLSSALEVVPRNAPTSFYEAAVFFRILNFALWLNGNKHNTVGRFVVYMYPYFTKDIAAGVLSEQRALEILTELFISLNFDADLYPGIQQGDNGQSLVLGGVDSQGNDVYNKLSELCLRASLEVSLIDPKINLRVNKNTPSEIYELGTQLTKQGLGFPQYSNDDVVIPALVNYGYSLEDARNYVVAACWEFIIPGVAMDIPNIDALNYPQIVNDAINANLLESTYEQLEQDVIKRINHSCEKLCAQTDNLFILPSPFQSMLMTNCIAEGKDISKGTRYNNYGFHGVGLSTAADSLAAIKKAVFDERTISKKQMLEALQNNYDGYSKERNLLIGCPKMGNNDDYVDDIAVKLSAAFADGLQGKKNDRGGIFRAGTGSAMYYIWFSANLGATADGRRKGEPFSANYSPSLNARVSGVLSVIASFTKPDLKRVCNGGPLTLEFHDTIFRNAEGTNKVAKLVSMFVERGGHQLQLNAINRDTLLDAQAHPENYKNLIVRVWGWSGYFNELDIEYQKHIISRLEFVS